MQLHAEVDWRRDIIYFAEPFQISNYSLLLYHMKRKKEIFATAHPLIRRRCHAVVQHALCCKSSAEVEFIEVLVSDIVGFPTRRCYSVLLLGVATRQGYCYSAGLLLLGVATRRGYCYSVRLLLLGEGVRVATRHICTTRLSVSLLGVLNTTALLRLSRMNDEYI